MQPRASLLLSASLLIATFLLLATVAPAPAQAEDIPDGLFLDPDLGIGFGIGGTNFDRDQDASGGRDIDAWTPQEGFQAGLTLGVPLFPGLYFAPRVGINYGQFSYLPDATDTQEETTNSFASIHFAIGLRALLTAPGTPVAVFVGGSFAMAANLFDKSEFVDAGNATNNQTLNTYYDLGIGGRLELGIGYAIAPGLVINFRFFVQGLNMPISKTVREFNDGNPDEIREFQDGVVQQTGTVRRKEELAQGVWGIVLGIIIFV